MSRLKLLQNDFQGFLLGTLSANNFQQAIVDDDKIGAAKRLSIYYDAYRLRLIEALANAYPMLNSLLGDEMFDATARGYIDTYPSRYNNMRWYGDVMDKHLHNTLPQYPIAAELAAFEWTLSLAFDAENSPILQLADLADIPPENWAMLSFRFLPSLYWLEFSWNTIAVWKALDAEQIPPTPIQFDQPENWIIWRHELNPQFKSLDEIEASALRSAMQGVTFGEICENLQFNLGEEEATMKAAQYLAGWLQEGLIANRI